MIRRSAHFQEGFVSLDMVNVREDVIVIKSCVIKVPPAFFRRACRSAMGLALQEIVSGMELQNSLRIPEKLEIVYVDAENAVFSDRDEAAKFRKNKLLDRLSKFANG